MRNKTEKFGKLVALPLQLLFRIVEVISPKLLVGMIKMSKGVFSVNFITLVIDRSLRHSMKRKSNIIPLDDVRLVADIPLQIQIDLSDYSQRKFYLYGFPEFMFDLLLFCDNSTMFFDVGANIGLISTAVARRLNPQNVFAFEPVQTTYEKLASNFSVNCPSANCFRLALSDKSAILSMGMPSGDSGNSSLEIEYIKNRLAIQKLSDTILDEKVQSISFDEFLKVENIEFNLRRCTKVALKIDVEGHEVKVLSGMSQFLSRKDLDFFLVIEIHYDNLSQVWRILDASGFVPISQSTEFLKSCNSEEFGIARDVIFLKSQNRI